MERPETRSDPDLAGVWLIVALLGSMATGARVEAQSPPPIAFGSSVNLVGQATSEDAIRAEIVGSLDLFTDVDLGFAALHVYVEGNTSPRGGGVSSEAPFANTDAGSALDEEGTGRVQISELRFAWPLDRRVRLHVGLMDLTGFLDVSRIANDENLFFLGQPFVNNPTILFPDYTLATTLVADIPSVPSGRIALVVSSSHGLADNPGASYGELFDLDAPGKGVFVGGRVRWQGPRWSGSIGGWASTAERTADLSARSLPAKGVFSVFAVESGVHSVDARVGLSHGTAGAEPFFGLTYLTSIGANALGVGVARTPALPSFVDRDSGHAEAFVRRSVMGVAYLTASLQWLDDRLLPQGVVDRGVWIFGFRLSATL